MTAQGIVFFCRLTTPNPKTLGEVVRFSSVLLPTKYLQSRIFMIFICQLDFSFLAIYTLENREIL